MAIKRKAASKRASSKRKAPVKSARSAAELKAAATSPTSSADDAPTIVGVGASAGGLEAVVELLRNVPASPRMAFLFVQHLDPKHDSALVQILARATEMTVQEAVDGVTIRGGHLYVAPPGAELTVRQGVLQLTKMNSSPQMPIDLCFRSLAADLGSRAIGVVLSGSASDGTLGLKAIKVEGGITFAQDDSAGFHGMPHSAVSAGAVDFVLPPRELAEELVRINSHSYMADDQPNAARLPQSDLSRIFELLQSTHELDFTHYKASTVERRIRRRMALNKLESSAEYLQLLREKPGEVDRLYADILIRVTSFFRDKDVFEALRQDVFPTLLAAHDREAQVRVWVPGCATGEEVYSLAITLLEAASALSVHVPIQIFGTDVSDAAIERARAGIYPDSIAADVATERLRSYFAKVDGSYRVSKFVRDVCVFARQNLTKDPPFSKLDLISCRNVMIYLGAPLQRKVMSIFHYALRRDGLLLLGSSESISASADLFSVADRRHKIYRKRAVASRLSVEFEPVNPPRQPERQPRKDAPPATGNVFHEADRIVMGRYAPPGVIINDDLEIIQFRGRTSAFLEPAPGAATFNILKMAREGLQAELRAAIHSSLKKDEPVRRQGIHLRSGNKTRVINIEVVPFLAPSQERYQLVMFEEEPRDEGKGSLRKGKDDGVDPRRLAALKRELEATREYLQSIIEEQEAMNEELRSANEEVQSSNEELQSTNEELETAKEELQSSNEELTTLNEELETRNQELAQVNNDLVNLLGSVDIPIVMLDNDLRIRRFNPGAQRILKLIPSDVGRAIVDLKMTLVLEDLEEMIHSVIEKLEVQEREVLDRTGHRYSLRIRPYRTTDNKIDGAVLVLIDLDLFRKR